MKLPRNLLVPLGALALLFLFNLLFHRSFFDLGWSHGHLEGSLVDVLNRSAPTQILAIGMTLVIATGGVDLSVGAVMAIAGAAAAALLAVSEDATAKPSLSRSLGHSVPMAVLTALGSGLLCGIGNGLLVCFAELQPIVATLLLMVAGRGVAQLIANGQIVTFHNDSFANIARGTPATVPNPVWIALGFALVIGLFVRRSSLGLFLESVGGNAQASRLSGIDAKWIKMAAYAICGLGAGLAGIIACADIKGADANNAGLNLELDAILAVAIGGTSLYGGKFSLAGAVLGAILMQALTTTVLSAGVPQPVTLVIKALVVVAVCFSQSPKLAEFRSRLRRRPA